MHMVKNTRNLPKAVQDCYELLLWLIPQLDKFPRLRRFTLGERLESVVLAVLELIVEAAYRKDKLALLRAANRNNNSGFRIAQSARLPECRHPRMPTVRERVSMTLPSGLPGTARPNSLSREAGARGE
jgi:hypothetical protein